MVVSGIIAEEIAFRFNVIFTSFFYRLLTLLIAYILVNLDPTY